MTNPAIPPVPELPKAELSVDDMLIAEWARDVVLMGSLSTSRSLQAHLGPSEIGQQCQRRIAYRILNTPITNIADPIAALMGTGFHGGMAEGLGRINHETGRYLIEQPVSYRGIRGTVDVYDRYKRRVIDWKTTDPARIRRYRAEGHVPLNYRVQAAIYAEALMAAGEAVENDRAGVRPARPARATSMDIAAFSFAPDKELADTYIDRYLERWRIASPTRRGAWLDRGAHRSRRCAATAPTSTRRHPTWIPKAQDEPHEHPRSPQPLVQARRPTSGSSSPCAPSRHDPARPNQFREGQPHSTTWFDVWVLTGEQAGQAYPDSINSGRPGSAVRRVVRQRHVTYYDGRIVEVRIGAGLYLSLG